MSTSGFRPDLKAGEDNFGEHCEQVLHGDDQLFGSFPSHGKEIPEMHLADLHVCNAGEQGRNVLVIETVEHRIGEYVDRIVSKVVDAFDRLIVRSGSAGKGIVDRARPVDADEEFVDARVDQSP